MTKWRARSEGICLKPRIIPVYRRPSSENRLQTAKVLVRRLSKSRAIADSESLTHETSAKLAAYRQPRRNIVLVQWRWCVIQAMRRG